MWRNKVLWSEGMFLRPQQFQQQERYLEGYVDRRVRALSRYGWGFEKLAIDSAALATGVVAIRQAAGVLPDGTPFSWPGEDLPPEPLLIDPALKDSVICLSIVTEREGVPNAVLDESATGDGLRFACRTTEVVDTNEGFPDPAPMQLARLRLRLSPAAELSGAHASLGVLRVRERRADGAVALHEQYIPPFLAANEAPLLGEYVRELQGLLRQRARSLAEHIVRPGQGGAAEIAEFLMLQACNRYTALFDHLAAIPMLHPESLYAQCAQLAGELTTFLDERRLARAFPPYRHDDLHASFAPVMAQLRRCLAMVIERSAMQIPLENRQYGVRVGLIGDKSLVDSAGFFLAVNAQLPAEVLRLRFPQQAKLAPTERIAALVNGQLPGIPMRPLPVKPERIPYHAGYTYFEIDTASELWRMLAQTGGVAIHVPDTFPGVELEMWAVRA